jgi:hypothetical protein
MRLNTLVATLLLYGGAQVSAAPNEKRQSFTGVMSVLGKLSLNVYTVTPKMGEPTPPLAESSCKP